LSDVRLFAFQEDFKPICSDARLGGDKADKGLSYPSGDFTGQAGWDMALQFTDLHDLAAQLSSGTPRPCHKWFSKCDQVQRGEVIRLGIMAHGVPGQVQINGPKGDPLTYANVEKYHDDLSKVGLFTRDGSTILFLSCLAAQGNEGTKLMTKLSWIWPHRKVVAFETLGYRFSGEMKRRGEFCTEVGVRETDDPYSWIPGMSTKPFDEKWKDLDAMPWESENSPHAKVVLDGVVIKVPKNEIPAPSKSGPNKNLPPKGALVGPPRPGARTGKH